MSRDPRDTQGAEADRRGPIDPERRAALVTAYVDGVAELPPDERHDIEAHLAREPGARAEADAVRALLDRLRALPPSDGAEEPDWAAMERSIRQAVSAAPARPWWRRWQWFVPAMTCATAAAVLLVIWPRSAPLPPHAQRSVNAAPVEPAAPVPAEPPDGDSVVALWLDGNELDVDVSASELGDVGLDLGAAHARQPIPQPIEDADEIGVLPATDLAWVDSLDDAALDRVERWLANPQDPGGPSRRHGSQSPRGQRLEQGPEERKI